MPVAPRVPSQAVVNALITWRGNVEAAARDLGMARNSLYERIRRMGIDLEGIRNVNPSKPVTPITKAVGVTGIDRSDRSVQPRLGAQKNASAIFPSDSNRRRLAGMEQAAAAADDKAVPIKTAPRRHQPIRIKPDQRDQLQRAAWDLQSRFQAPTDESLILEQFIEEAFPGWLAGKVQKNGKAEKVKR